MAAVLGTVYLAVLPMASTIALRNVALLGLLLVLAWQFRRIRAELGLGWMFWAWAVFLLLFPWISADVQTAWQSVSGQWGRSLLAMLAGAGLAALLSGGRWGSAFHLGLISAVPVLVHLAMVFWRSLETGAIAWGYWGRETHHADLGFAAGQAAVLLSAVIVTAGKRLRLGAVVLLLAALLSTVLARSRAGLVFAVLGSLAVFFLAYFMQGRQQRRHALLLALVVVPVTLGLLFLAFKEDARWHGLTDKLLTGLQGNALQLACEGTASIEAGVRERFGDEAYAQQVLEAVRHGDGSRVVVLRAGLDLSLQHPLGLDGSREAFRKLLIVACPKPDTQLLHAHSGWVDTPLAIGWLGAGLYLLLLLSFARLGWAGLQVRPIQAWALVLLALSVFWILRGLTDSVYRDHMLEMQGFVLAYGAAVVRRILRQDPAR